MTRSLVNGINQSLYFPFKQSINADFCKNKLPLGCINQHQRQTTEYCIEHKAARAYSAVAGHEDMNTVDLWLLGRTKVTHNQQAPRINKIQSYTGKHYVFNLYESSWAVYT